MPSPFPPQRVSAGYLLPTFTGAELGALREAIRYSQEDCEEAHGRLDPTLSRIQRKLGEEPNS